MEGSDISICLRVMLANTDTIPMAEKAKPKNAVKLAFLGFYFGVFTIKASLPLYTDVRAIGNSPIYSNFTRWKLVPLELHTCHLQA